MRGRGCREKERERGGLDWGVGTGRKRASERKRGAARERRTAGEYVINTLQAGLQRPACGQHKHRGHTERRITESCRLYSARRGVHSLSSSRVGAGHCTVKEESQSHSSRGGESLVPPSLPVYRHVSTQHGVFAWRLHINEYTLYLRHFHVHRELCFHSR